jgi:hypothetical protein
MSYLTNYATRRLHAGAGASDGVRVDEDCLLNLAGHHANASVRVFVEDTTGRRWRRQPPQPKVRLRISDCANEISLWFEVDSPERRENSMHKIDTLLGSLTRFRDALDAECELYEHRSNHRQR